MYGISQGLIYEGTLDPMLAAEDYFDFPIPFDQVAELPVKCARQGTDRGAVLYPFSHLLHAAKDR